MPHSSILHCFPGGVWPYRYMAMSPASLKDDGVVALYALKCVAVETSCHCLNPRDQMPAFEYFVKWVCATCTYVERLRYTK